MCFVCHILGYEGNRRICGHVIRVTAIAAVCMNVLEGGGRTEHSYCFSLCEICIFDRALPYVLEDPV